MGLVFRKGYSFRPYHTTWLNLRPQDSPSSSYVPLPVLLDAHLHVTDHDPVINDVA